MGYRETGFEGLALSGRHVFCPQPDEAPHVVGKVASPIFTRACAKADRADCQIEQSRLLSELRGLVLPVLGTATVTERLLLLLCITLLRRRTTGAP
jgi:hypothetical protein